MKNVEKWLQAAVRDVYDECYTEMVREFWSDEKTRRILLAFLSGLSIYDGSGRWNVVRAVAEAELPENDSDVEKIRNLREAKIRWVTSQNSPVVPMGLMR